MTTLGKPIYFIATANSDQCRYFYESILSFTCLSEDSFALVFDFGSTTLRIQKVESVPNVNYTVLGWEVIDIKKIVNKLSNNGVQFERYAQVPQDDLGIWCAPGGALIAWFKDPDGNTLSITEV